MVGVVQRAGVALVVFGASAALAQPSFTRPELPSGYSSQYVWSLSADGRIAVVDHYDSFNEPTTSTWSEGTWIELWNEEGFAAASRYGFVSGDGRTVFATAGESRDVAGLARRIGSGPIEALGGLPGLPLTYASGVSFDGSVAVGSGADDSLGTITRAFRWTAETGLAPLFPPDSGFVRSAANDVSDDGRVIVGVVDRDPSDYDWVPFLWTEHGGFVQLPGLPGSAWPGKGNATAVSGDGRVVVGTAYGPNGEPRMVRWIDGQIEDLGLVPGYGSAFASEVDYDGSTIIGSGAREPGAGELIAMAWTAERGPQLLTDFLAGHGVEVPAGTRLQLGVAISSDGRTFGGAARSADSRAGFIATIPAPAGLLVFGAMMLRGQRERRDPSRGGV